MPNEIKNALKASTSHVTTNHTMSRQLPVAGSSTVSVMVWTISGIVLASCGGGGGGGAGGSGLSVSGGGSNGDGGGGGSNASGPSGKIARVVDGPVKDAAVYFDIDGDGEVSDSERAEQTQNGDPMYITDANGYVNAPIAFEGHFFIANVDNATDTATGDTLSGEYQSLSTGGIATPITDLITDQIGASGSNADAQGVLDDIFGTDGLVTVADIRDAEKYKIQEYDVPKPTLPSDPTNAEEQAQYDRDITKYKTSVIMKSSLALSEIDKDEAFTNLESSTARVDALKQIFDDDPNNGDSALMVRIDARVDAGREILGISKPLAQPDSSISPINEDSVFRFPQNSEAIFGFDDPNGNSDDAAASRFTGIYVKSSVDFSQADDDAHTVNLLYDGSALSGHEVARGDSLPDNLPPEAGFYYVSYENLSRLSISPSDDDSGTLEVEYYVFDGEQWSDKASLEITVSPVDDPATDVAVGTRFLTAIDENTDLTGGMKVADLDVTDADGAPHGLVVGGTNAAFFRIRNDDELWLVLQEGQLDYETTPTLAVQVEVAGANPAVRTGNITVTVNNVNDNLPIIEQLGSQIPLNEGTFPDTPTNTGYRYTASDADGGTSRLTLSGDPRERFQIDTNGNLQIKANSEFDYENPDDSSITLTITAADSGVGSGNQPINTTETVTIRLRNINDNPPVITQSGRQVPLDEGTFSSDTNTGYRYTVSDADGGTSTLSVSGDPQNRFAIDASGDLQIKAGSEFNYESLDEGAITLTITATDSGVGPGSPAVTDTETVIITFGDVNEAPTATSRASISTNDHTAYALEAVDFGFSDVDAGDNEFDSVIITSLPGAGQGTLALNGASVRVGDAITFAQIDAGQLVYTPNEVSQGQPYNAQIGYRVLDDGDGAGAHKLSSATATLVIGVGANQSATGVAVGTRFLTAIDENTVTTGMKVADLRVDDADGPPHRLEVRGDNIGFFEIRNEDELWLVVDTGETLDYETTPTLAVQVGVSGDSTITPVNITVAVNNVNDNAPEISLEGGQNQVQNPLDEGIFPNTPTDTGYSYTASDADGGTSTLRVSGDAQDRFAIDASGKLQIKAGAEFDYETPADRAITLTITATDSGVGSGISPVAATQEVIITFGDANDAPTATPKLGISTNDNAPYTFSAVDFGFRDEDVGDLDNQFDSVIITSLPAQGQGTLELNGNQVIVNTPIIFTDINNGRLVYTPTEVSQGQPYNAQIGYRVLDDGDTDGTHKLSSDVASLVIGVVGGQPATGVTLGTQFLTAIDENTDLTAGMKVADLTVDDADGPPHRLEVRGANAGFFEIRNHNELWLVLQEGQTLDYETTPTLAVQVGVSGDSAINTNPITVTVNNVNDNTPVIRSEGEQILLIEGRFFTRYAGTDTGYSYTASDPDGGTSVLSLSGDDRFHLDASGNLQVKHRNVFDYENTDDRAIMLTITATDSGEGSGISPAAATHEVTINFGDVNEAPTATPRTGISTADNTPYVFKSDDFGFSDEDADAQFVSIFIRQVPKLGILTLGEIQLGRGWYVDVYSINAGDLVYTPAATRPGQTTYNAEIDYRVHDGGGAGDTRSLNSATATLVIAVGGNQPATGIALGTQDLTTIDENTDLTAGMKVADLTVTDTDGPPHRLEVRGANADFFEIRNHNELWLVLNTGEVFDFEAPPTLTVEVAVPDSTIAPVAITVTVNNVNEAPTATPRVGLSTADNTPYTFEAVDFGFSDVDADDIDDQFDSVIITSLPEQGTLTLDDATVSADDAISLDDITDGLLIYTPTAPPPGQPIYNAEIGYRVVDDGDAADGANKLSSDAASLVIAVGGNQPATSIARETQFLTAIDENMDLTAGMKVADLTVDDTDGPPHRLEVRGDNTGFFVIRNEDELWLVLQEGQTLDYESTPALTVQVGVSGIPWITPAGITVAVNNINDNTPVIERTGTQNKLHEGTFTSYGRPLNTGYNYTASDADGGTSTLHVSGDPQDRFEIDADGNLRIKVDSTFDYEVPADRSITLTITATDSGVGSGNQPINATDIVTITFTNLGDEPVVITRSGAPVPLDEGLYSIDTDTGYRYVASDPDNPGQTISLTVTGDPQDRFQIDRDGNLQIKAGSSFDYETPEDRAINLGITHFLGNLTKVTEPVTITFRDVSTEINIDSGDAYFSIAIDGNLVTGAVLTATEITPDPDIDDAVYSYQWYHIGAGASGAAVDILGATSKSYTIADTDEGKRIGVRVSYEEDSFQSDRTTPTGTETITAELPIVDFTEIRDISSEIVYSFEYFTRILLAGISTEETGARLILREFGGNDRSVFDITNPHRATESSAESSYVYGISGVDKDHFMFVQDGSRISIVSKTGFNYENPTDSDQDNNYEFTLVSSVLGVRPISYTLTIVDDISEARVKIATASIIETSSSIKFTSLEDAVRSYSGIDDALLGVSATFGGTVVDGANPHRATVTFEVASQDDIVFTYELSGDDVNDVLLVQDGNDVSLITVAGLDYENPADEDGMSTYSVVETITTTSPNIPSGHRDVQTTYTLNVIDDISEVSIEVYENHPLYKPLEIDSVDLQGYQLTEGYVDNALFTIDRNGEVRWEAIPDHEAPRDGDGDNLYEIELYRTDSSGQIDRVQVDIRVKDIGIDPPPEEDYSAMFLLSSSDIADEHMPRDFVQHLIYEYQWRVPATGPVIIQYSIDADQLASFFNNNQLDISRFHSLLDAALLSFEQAANLKFVEVAHREDGDDVPYINIEFGGFRTFAQHFLRESRVGITHAERILDIDGLYTRLTLQANITHELGHALGLHHPFEEGAGWPGDEAYRYSLLSVMSYNKDVLTLQPADIETLQFLYGAPGTNFMGVESIMAESAFANKLASRGQTVASIDENTDLTAGIKITDIVVTDQDRGAFGTLEIVGDHAEFFEIRSSDPNADISSLRNGELWLVLEEGETLEDIARLEVYLRIAEKHAVRTGDITITVDGDGISGAEGSSGLVGGATGDSGQIKIDETVNEGQSVIANLIDLELGEIDLTEITVGGGDKDQVQIRQAQNGGVLEFVSAPDFEAPEDDGEDNVYEITLYDDLISIEVDITVIDIPEL